MMVAATDGNISIANFEMYFFSMPATPRGGFDAGTLRRIKGSTATDQWQSGQRPAMVSVRLPGIRFHRRARLGQPAATRIFGKRICQGQTEPWTAPPWAARTSFPPRARERCRNPALVYDG